MPRTYFSLRKKIAELQRENKRLRLALITFGVHSQRCNLMEGDIKFRCDCGLESVQEEAS